VTRTIVETGDGGNKGREGALSGLALCQERLGRCCGFRLVEETFGLIKDVRRAELLELRNRKCDRCVGKRRFGFFERLLFFLQHPSPSEGLCRGLDGNAGAAERAASPDLGTIGIEGSRDWPGETEESRKVGGIADRMAINEDRGRPVIV